MHALCTMNRTQRHFYDRTQEFSRDEEMDKRALA